MHENGVAAGIARASDLLAAAKLTVRQVPERLGRVDRREIEAGLPVVDAALGADMEDLRGNIAAANVLLQRLRFPSEEHNALHTAMTALEAAVAEVERAAAAAGYPVEGENSIELPRQLMIDRSRLASELETLQNQLQKIDTELASLAKRRSGDPAFADQDALIAYVTDKGGAQSAIAGRLALEQEVDVRGLAHAVDSLGRIVSAFVDTVTPLIARVMKPVRAAAQALGRAGRDVVEAGAALVRRAVGKKIHERRGATVVDPRPRPPRPIAKPARPPAAKEAPPEPEPLAPAPWFRRKVRSALFVDFDNMVGVLGRDFVQKVPHWLGWLEEGIFDERRTRRSLVHKSVYWSRHNDRHRQAFEEHGFRVVVSSSPVIAGKSVADTLIASDVLELCYEQRDVREFILLTTDIDFVAVISRLRYRRKDTVVMGNEDNVSFRVYSDHADRVIPVAMFRKALTFQRPPRLAARWRQRLSPDLLRAWMRGFADGVPAVQARMEGAPSAELERAARLVAELAQRTPDHAIGRRAVIRLLTHEVRAFAARGSSSYLGCGSYARMIDRLGELRDDLQVVKYANAGRALMYRAREN